MYLWVGGRMFSEMDMEAAFPAVPQVNTQGQYSIAQFRCCAHSQSSDILHVGPHVKASNTSSRLVLQTLPLNQHLINKQCICFAT